MRNYVGGTWTSSGATETFPVINPATGETLRTLYAHGQVGRDKARLLGWAALPLLFLGLFGAIWAGLGGIKAARLIRSRLGPATPLIVALSGYSAANCLRAC